MTLKRDAKFKEKLTFTSKYDFRNIVNFHPTTQMTQNFTLMGSCCPNYIRFELENRKELSSMTMNSDAKFE